MSSVHRIAAVQMVSGPDVAANLAAAERLIGEAAAAGAGLVVLPEYFPLITADETAKLRLCEPDGEGPLQAFLQDAARRHGVWLIGGTIPLAGSDPGRVKNAILVFDDTGQRVARYDKIHLFGFRKGAEQYNESATIAPGHAATAFDADGFRVGLSICYDLRFPELYRSLGACDLLVVPAAFTETTGRAHWEILLRARAIENQCYVLAIGQGGRHENGRETHGNSMLVDPWGTILDRKLKGPGIVIGDVDPAFIADTRASLPALQHRVL